jgi:DNA-binding MarR family transcriptional regulator
MATRPDTNDALARLFDETVALYHRLAADAAAIHRFGSLSGPRRTVLIGLSRSGPQTVAQMARVRAQSRQRFQPLVNALLDDGLVAARTNPSHKQSPLIALTARGERAVKQIIETERTLRARVKLAASPQSVMRAAAVLRGVREALEDQLPHLIEAMPRRSKK